MSISSLPLPTGQCLLLYEFASLDALCRPVYCNLPCEPNNSEIVAIPAYGGWEQHMRFRAAISLVLSAAVVPATLNLATIGLAQHHHPLHHPVSAPHPIAGPIGVHPGGVPAAGHPGAAVGGNQYTANYNSNYYNSYNNVYWGSPGFLMGGYGYPYRYGLGWYGGGFGPYILPPLVLPAQTLFGPQPVQQLMGVGPLGAGPAAAGPILGAPAGDAGPAPRQPRKVRVANAEAKARAGKFIDFGDALFAKQRFREALERYKLAAQQAPDMAEIYLRQGITSVATGQYESAGRYFRRALKMDDWNAAHLQLDQLYGNDRIAKEAHLEALALAIQAAAHDANLLFVMGMELYLNGQPERATAFFLRSGQLGGNDDHLLDPFIPPARPGQPIAKAGADL
jgi:Flp pilus assembly protein TadD